MKQIICMIVTLLLSLTTALAANALTGDGTEASPYLVSTEGELRTAVGKENAFVKLTDDITVTERDICPNSGVTLDLDVHTPSFSGINYLDITTVSNVAVKNGMIEGNYEYAQACVNIIESTGVRLENLEIGGNTLIIVSVYSFKYSTEVELHNCKISNSNKGDTTLEIHSDGADCTVTATQCDLYPSSDSGITYSSYCSTFSLNGTQVASPDDFYYSETAEIGGYSDSWKATTITQDTDPNANTAVNHTVAPAYTVTIPKSVEIGDTVTIKAEGVIIEKGTSLTVAVKDTTYDTFTLENEQEDTLNYTITKDGVEISQNEIILTADPQISNNASTELKFNQPAETDIKYSGAYTGNVTFTISVSDAA